METRVYYAPNQSDLPHLAKRLRNNSVVKAFLRELNEVDVNDQTDEMAIYKETLRRTQFLLADKTYKMPSKENGYWQAVMWVLCMVMCKLKELDELREVKRYYAGSSFGEFWAITYDLYLRKEITIVKAVNLAYLRGIAMGNYHEGFAKIIVPVAISEKILKLAKEKNIIYGTFSRINSIFGVFGKKKDLQGIADELNIDAYDSIPFHSEYLYTAGKEYSRNFDGFSMGDAVITDKEGTISQQIHEGFYTNLNEIELLDAIQERIGKDLSLERVLVRL